MLSVLPGGEPGISKSEGSKEDSSLANPNRHCASGVKMKSVSA